MIRDSDYIKLINSARWLKLRRERLAQHPLCENCIKQDRITPATEVHHKVPIETAVTFSGKAKLCYDPTNIVALCRQCHINEHRLLNSFSKDEAERRKQIHKDWFKKTFLD